MRPQRPLIALVLMAICLLSLTGACQGHPGGGKRGRLPEPAEPRTYFLWERELNASVAGACYLELGGELSTAIVLLNGTGTWRLLALSSDNGTLLAVSPERRGVAREVAASSGHVLVVANGSLAMLNSSLGVVWERAWPGEEVEFLGFLSKGLAILQVGRTLLCLSLEKPEVVWTRELEEADVLRSCLLPGRGLLVLMRKGGNWTYRVLGLGGDLQAEGLDHKHRLFLR